MCKITMKHSYEIEQIKKIEKIISLYVDSFLVISEEGDLTQIALAYTQAKNEFLKLGPDMHHLSVKIGGDLQIFVADFLESIDTILHGQGILDEDVITRCNSTSAKLKSQLNN